MTNEFKEGIGKHNKIWNPIIGENIMKTKSPSSATGTVINTEGDNFPNEPGWYRWVPNYGVGEGCPEYVMVNYYPGYKELRVWRASAKRNLPVCIMIGEWSFFAKLNNDKK